jgi:putative acetyltransferase
VWIREETPDDFDAVHAVTAAAFGRDDEAHLVRRIRVSEQYVPTLSFVAEDDGEINGHVMLSYVDLAGSQVLELAPLSVAPSRQGEGVGSALARAALEAAERHGEPLVLLLGDPAYYSRFGFVLAAEHGIHPPDAAMAPAFQVAVLPAYHESLRGRVTFSPAFG